MPYEIRCSIDDSTGFDFRDLMKDCRPGEIASAVEGIMKQKRP